VRASLLEDLEGAKATMNGVAAAGISFKTVTDDLLEDGLKQFSTAFEKLLKAVDVAQK
jgi:transaldolase